MTKVRSLLETPFLMFALLSLIFSFVGLDLWEDLSEGITLGHALTELTIMICCVAGLLMLASEARVVMSEMRVLNSRLEAAREDALRWKAEAQDHLRGLGMAIDRQFERWDLTAAEREIGILMLKGLSHKEIAQMRGTSERTVRQQALAVYRKAELGSRAELAAFFLEDLLLPHEQRQAPLP